MAGRSGVCGVLVKSPAQAAGIGALADKEFLHRSLELNARGLRYLTEGLQELVHKAFDSAGRQSQADKERAESAVIAGYLPEQLSIEEIAVLVADAIASTGAADQGMRGIGPVMGVLKGQLAVRGDKGKALQLSSILDIPSAR